MKRMAIGILLSLCFAICLVTCKTKTVYIPVETKIVDSLVIRDTTIDIQLVPYRDSTSVRADSSYLSNPYAYSWARIGTDGLLHHSLAIWPQLPLSAEVQYIDRIRHIEVPKPYPVEKEVFVEKELSWLDRTYLNTGKIFLLGIIIYGLFRLWKRKT